MECANGCVNKTHSIHHPILGFRLKKGEKRRRKISPSCLHDLLSMNSKTTTRQSVHGRKYCTSHISVGAKKIIIKSQLDSLNNAVSWSELKNDIYCLKTAKSSPSSKFVHIQHSWPLSMFEGLQKKERKKVKAGRGRGGGGGGGGWEQLRLSEDWHPRNEGVKGRGMDSLLGEGIAVSPSPFGKKRRLACIRAETSHRLSKYCNISLRDGKKSSGLSKYRDISELRKHRDCLNTAISLSELKKSTGLSTCC